MVDVVSREEFESLAKAAQHELNALELLAEAFRELENRVDALEKQGTNQDPEPWWEGGSGTLPVPRIITAGECRAGMQVAARAKDSRSNVKAGQWYTDTVTELTFDQSRYIATAFVSRFDIIVLLSEPTA